MTDISLSSYIKAAREGYGGVIRETSEDRSKLVNKGTFGNWIATHLGMGDSKSRDDRNEQALEGFRRALVDRYGSDIAGGALEHAGLGSDVKQMTGRDVLKAARFAQRSILENRSGNEDEFRRRRTEGESKLDSNLQKRAFRQWYRQEVVSRTQFGRVKLDESPNGLEQRTVDRIRAMNDCQLVRSLELRRALGGEMVSLLRSVDRQTRTDPLLGSMMQIDDMLGDLAEVEQVPPEEREGWRQAMQDYLVQSAMATIGRTDSGILLGVQLKALSDDAPLRAIYAEALALSGEGSEAEQAVARRVMELCERMVGGMAQGLGPNANLESLDLERLKGGTVGDEARLGIKSRLQGYSETVEMNARVRPEPIGSGNMPPLEEVPPKEPPIKVEQVEQKAPRDPALLRARNQWVESIRKVKPEPEELPSIDEDDSENQPDYDEREKAEDDRRWAIILRERSLKATLDKPIQQYMLDTGCSLSKAVDLFHDLLLEDEAFHGLVNFFDQQTLIDSMVEIEETGILREGPRRTEYEGISKRREEFELEKQLRLQPQISIEMPEPDFDRHVCYEFFDQLAGDVPGIGNDRDKYEWDGDSVALQRNVARRIRELVVGLKVDIDTLCDALRGVLAEAAMLPAAKQAIEAGLDLVQHPTAGAQLVNTLVAMFPIRRGQEGAWSSEDMAFVIDQHVARLLEDGEMSRGAICDDLATTIMLGGFEHDLDPQTVDDILDLLSQLKGGG